MTTTESYGCDKHGEDAYQGCAMCDLETLRERLHEAELVAASWKREAELNEQAANESSGYAKRLAEADALLRNIYSYAEDQGMETLMDMIDTSAHRTAQQDRSQMLMAELTPDATKAMNMRANGERPWSFHDSFDVCRNDRLLLLQHSDALSARLADLEAERTLIVARAENAEAALAYAVSTGDECAIEVEALRSRLAEAEALRKDAMEAFALIESAPARGFDVYYAVGMARGFIRRHSLLKQRRRTGQRNPSGERT